LKVKCDEPLSNFPFNFSLRRYSKEINAVRGVHIDLVRKVLVDSVNVVVLLMDNFVVAQMRSVPTFEGGIVGMSPTLSLLVWDLPGWPRRVRSWCRRGGRVGRRIRQLASRASREGEESIDGCRWESDGVYEYEYNNMCSFKSVFIINVDIIDTI
jgi:hypothetical protein